MLTWPLSQLLPRQGCHSVLPEAARMGDHSLPKSWIQQGKLPQKLRKIPRKQELQVSVEAGKPAQSQPASRAIRVQPANTSGLQPCRPVSQPSASLTGCRGRLSSDPPTLQISACLNSSYTHDQKPVPRAPGKEATRVAGPTNDSHKCQPSQNQKHLNSNL